MMRRALVAGMAAVFLLAGASVARADHTHVLILPNGSCAILAADGNEKYQILPAVLFANNPNVDADDAAGGLEACRSTAGIRSTCRCTSAFRAQTATSR
jgi:hypothetical protein